MSTSSPVSNRTPYKYGMKIYWSAEDERFLPEVPDLPGCIADGDTPAAAAAMAEEVIAFWIDVAREDGRPVPKATAYRVTA